MSQRGTEEKTKAERKKELEIITCQSGESCTSFAGLVGSPTGSAQSKEALWQKRVCVVCC